MFYTSFSNFKYIAVTNCHHLKPKEANVNLNIRIHLLPVVIFGKGGDGKITL